MSDSIFDYPDPSIPDDDWNRESSTSRPPPVERICWRCAKVCAIESAVCPHCSAKFQLEAHASPPKRIKPSDTYHAKSDAVPSVIIGFALMMVCSLIVGCLRITKNLESPEDFETATIVAEIFDSSIVLFLWATLRIHLASEQTGEKRTFARSHAWLISLLVLPLVVLLAEGYQALFREWLPKLTEASELPPTELNTLNIILICVQPALIEELFFRYLAFRAIRRYASLHLTVWCTAAMFAMAHVYNPLFMPMLLLGGALLGYARAGGGLILSMILHFLYNFCIAFVVV